MIVNINNTVKFRITKFGKETLENYLVYLKDYYDMPDSVIVHLKAKFAKECIEMQLWDFMNVFGPVCKIGMGNFTVDNEIEICGGAN